MNKFIVRAKEKLHNMNNNNPYNILFIYPQKLRKIVLDNLNDIPNNTSVATIMSVEAALISGVTPVFSMA